MHPLQIGTNWNLQRVTRLRKYCWCHFFKLAKVNEKKKKSSLKVKYEWVRFVWLRSVVSGCDRYYEWEWTTAGNVVALAGGTIVQIQLSGSPWTTYTRSPSGVISKFSEHNYELTFNEYGYGQSRRSFIVYVSSLFRSHILMCLISHQIPIPTLLSPSVPLADLREEIDTKRQNETGKWMLSHHLLK